MSINDNKRAKKNNLFLIIIVLLVAALLIWWFFIRGTADSATPIDVQTPASASMSADGAVKHLT